MNKRLLFITCHKLDDNNGGSNGSKGFIRCFASLFDDCSLIYPEFEGDTAPYIPAAYKLYPCHDSRLKLQKGIDMYRGVVSGLYYHIRRHLRNHQYDVIVIDHSVTGTSLVKTIRKAATTLITIHHNVERDYLRDNGKERPLTYRIPYIYYAKKAERECLRHSDVNLTVTESDAAVFRSWQRGRDLHIHHWLNSEWRPIADKVFAPRERAATFIITGSLCFLQSLQPIVEFVRRYWPLMRQECPQARLVIAGRNPANSLLQACQGEADIRVVPNPDDINALVQQANYYVCPINTGSGRKLRIMDGLRQGLPILCHEIAAAGYERMAAEGCLFVYRNESSFVDSLRRMLASDIAPQTVYQAFKANYSVEAGIARLREILRQEHII